MNLLLQSLQQAQKHILSIFRVQKYNSLRMKVLLQETYQAVSFYGVIALKIYVIFQKIGLTGNLIMIIR